MRFSDFGSGGVVEEDSSDDSDSDDDEGDAQSIMEMLEMGGDLPARFMGQLLSIESQPAVVAIVDLVDAMGAIESDW